MPFQRLDLEWALTASLPPLDFVLPGLLPGAFGLLVAPGATGKSQLALDIAASLAIGRPIAGGLFPATGPSKVVVLAGEECRRMLAERIRAQLQLTEQGDPHLYQNLVVIPGAGEPCLLVSDGKPTPLFDELQAICDGARLIVIDPLRRMHDGDENDSSVMTQFVVAMERLGKSVGAAVLGVHHANRASSGDGSSQNASRGSSALVDGARWQLNLWRLDEKSAEIYNVLEAERALYVAADLAKANYVAPRARSWLKRQPGGRLSLVALPTKGKPQAKTFGGARTL